MIRLGASYEVKYLWNGNSNSKRIETKKGFHRSYLVWNRPDAQVFCGKLHIKKNKSAVFKAKYTTYSGVKEKFTTWFGKDTLEIIGDNDKEEKTYFEGIQ